MKRVTAPIPIAAAPVGSTRIELNFRFGWGFGSAYRVHCGGGRAEEEGWRSKPAIWPKNTPVCMRPHWLRG